MEEAERITPGQTYGELIEVVVTCGLCAAKRITQRPYDNQAWVDPFWVHHGQPCPQSGG